MAFQPIVRVTTGRIYAYEALVRGPHGESAASVLERVTPENRYAFDQTCRVTAITLAARVGLIETGALLSINFMPGAVYSPKACIRLTLETAQHVGFPTDRLIFEIVESEEVRDRKHLLDIVREYQRHGFKLAVDDFGAGYSGMNLLADVPTDVVKLDMALIRDVHKRPAARAIVGALVRLAPELNTEILAEGVETDAEYRTLLDCGVTLMQGYLFARPAFESLPPAAVPDRFLRSLPHG